MTMVWDFILNLNLWVWLEKEKFSGSDVIVESVYSQTFFQ